MHRIRYIIMKWGFTSVGLTFVMVLITWNLYIKMTVLVLPVEYETGGKSFSFLSQIKNPCFLDNYDISASDKTYYSNNALITRIEKKYAENYADVLHRAKVQVYDDSGIASWKRLRCLPYYYLLGVAKSGSTDLYTRLTCHKHVARPLRKEPSWLSSHRFENYSLSNYIDVFDPTAVVIAHSGPLGYGMSKQVPIIVGDHSSNTLTAWNSFRPEKASNHPQATPALVRSLTPDARFIVMLRHPVERAYSHYKMHHAISSRHFHNGIVQAIKWFRNCIKKQGYSEYCLFIGSPSSSKEEMGKYGEYVEPYKNAILSLRHGVYHAYVSYWFQFFPREQFLFIKSEEYYKDTYTYIADYVLPFLGLEELRWYDKFTKTCIAAAKPKHVTSRLVHIGEKNINVDFNEPMLNVTRQMLTEFYREHNERLSRLLDSDIWLWE